MRILGLLFLCIFSLSALAEGVQYEEGTHYQKLDVPVRTRDANVVEVTEYFSYQCPHCYRLEPLISQWKETLPADVEFNRSPAIWRAPGYETAARTYYTAQALGVLEQIHQPFFNAIHAERRRLTELQDVARFMAEQGVDPEVFAKTFQDSFGVKAMYQQAVARQRIYRSGGVPAVIVNGKYRIEAAMVGNSSSEMLRVASFLIDREKRLVESRTAGAD